VRGVAGRWHAAVLLQWDGYVMAVMPWQPLLRGKRMSLRRALPVQKLLAAALYGRAHKQHSRSSSTLHPPTSCRPLDHRFVQDLGSHRALFIGREGQRDEQRDWRQNGGAQVGWGGSESDRQTIAKPLLAVLP